MKAAWYDRYGPADVLEIREVARPEPKDDEILVQVFATSVTTADWRFRASEFPKIMWLAGRAMAGLFRPKSNILGSEFAGRVVAKLEAQATSPLLAQMLAAAGSADVLFVTGLESTSGAVGAQGPTQMLPASAWLPA